MMRLSSLFCVQSAPRTFSLLCLVVTTILWLVVSAAANNVATQQDLLLLENIFDGIREMDNNATRAGIVDRITTPEGRELGVCHIGFLQPVTHPYLASLLTGGFGAVHLAMNMLNRGDGSVIEEIQGLNEQCPIRFTAESLDSTGPPSLSVGVVNNVLQRKTPEQRQVCSFIGSVRSSVTIPTSILTGLAERPHLSAWAQSSRLDDKNKQPE